MSAKQVAQNTESVTNNYTRAPASMKSEIDRALEILRSLPTIRRYGDDTEALKETLEILERVKGEL